MNRLANQGHVAVWRLDMNAVNDRGGRKFNLDGFELLLNAVRNGQRLFADGRGGWCRRGLAYLHVRQPFDRR